MFQKRRTPRRGGVRAGAFERACKLYGASPTLPGQPRRPTAEAVKAAIDAGAFYRAELTTMKPTSRRGWVDGGLCPFHQDRNPGSWKVNTLTGAFRCYSCDAHGNDVIAFVMQRRGLSFPEALEALAGEWGVVP